jgi:hypothetical protein
VLQCRKRMKQSVTVSLLSEQAGSSKRFIPSLSNARAGLGKISQRILVFFLCCVSVASWCQGN